MTTPWRSDQDTEKANETVAWQALPCRFDALRLAQGKGLPKSKSREVAQRLPMCDDVLIIAIGRKRRSGKLQLHAGRY